MTDHLGDQLLVLHAVTDAQAALLGLRRRPDARVALVSFVERLGATVVPAHPNHADALPIDLSLGTGEPVVPVAAAGTPLRARLERTLPDLVHRAHHIAAMCDRLEGERAQGAIDHLTGAPTRAQLQAALARAVPGEDRLLGFVVGEGGWLIEPFGRMRIDGLVRSLADVVRDVRSPLDGWGRVAGHGVALLALRTDVARAEQVVAEVRRRWVEERGLDVPLQVVDLAVPAPPSTALEVLETELGLTEVRA